MENSIVVGGRLLACSMWRQPGSGAREALTGTVVSPAYGFLRHLVADLPEPLRPRPPRRRLPDTT